MSFCVIVWMGVLSCAAFGAWHEGILLKTGDGRFLSAQCTPAIALEPQGVPLHGERVECEQSVCQRLAYAGYTLYRLCRLHCAQHAGNRSEDTDHGACLDLALVGWFRE